MSTNIEKDFEAPVVYTLRVNDVMQPQPWPLVVVPGGAVLSGRPDARALLGWRLADGEAVFLPADGIAAYKLLDAAPIFAGVDGGIFELPEQRLTAMRLFTGDLTELAESNAAMVAAWKRVSA